LALASDTATQNAHLDRVAAGTSTMLANARAIRDLVSEQNTALDRVDGEMAGTHERVHAINTRSALSKYR
jgi:hypothetical protein